MNQPVYFLGMTEPLVVSMALISLSSMQARTNSSSSSSPSCRTVKISDFRFQMCFRFQPLHLVEVEAAEEVRGAGGHRLGAEAGCLVQRLQKVGNLLHLNGA